VSPVSGPADRSGGAAGGAGDRPYLTVVRGVASAEEVAALTAVLAAKNAAAARLAGASAAGRGGRTFGWASRQAMLRKPLSHGPGAWRASARPGAGT